MAPSRNQSARSVRFAGAFLALASFVALTGCGDDDSSTSGEAASTVAQADAQAATAVDPGIVTPAQGAALIAALGADLTIIDVRTPTEFSTGHIPAAVNIDVESGGFSAAIADLDRAAPYVVYCQSGRRSALAAAAMVQAGFTRVYDVGGIQDWMAAGQPIVVG